MDEGGIFTADQNLSNGRSGRQHSISRYREFIRSFRNSFDNTFIYRDQLRRNVGCAATRRLHDIHHLCAARRHLG